MRAIEKTKRIEQIKSDDGDTTALINRYIAAQLKKVNS